MFSSLLCVCAWLDKSYLSSSVSVEDQHFKFAKLSPFRPLFPCSCLVLYRASFILRKVCLEMRIHGIHFLKARIIRLLPLWYAALASSSSPLGWMCSIPVTDPGGVVPKSALGTCNCIFFFLVPLSWCKAVWDVQRIPVKFAKCGPFRSRVGGCKH